MMSKFNKNLTFHNKEINEILAHFSSSVNGLTDAEVESSRKTYGFNEIPEARKRSWLWLLIKQFKSLMVFILLVAAIISYFTEHAIDAYVILAVIIINAVIGFLQELKAEQAVASLRNMIVQRARVLRNDETLVIPAKELVPGDIIILEEGESIPADARLIEAKNLLVTEASLTGESIPVLKHTHSLAENTALADQKNMLFKGTFLAGGYAKAIVCGIGLNTAIGEIAETLSSIKKVKTNFQQKTDVLAKQMAVIAIGSAVLLFAVGYFMGNFEWDELLLVSIAALVSAIPEGLPAVLSIVLAIGSNRMAKRNAIIREFTSVETLGAVTTIITDKTGTLTQNTLTVRKVFTYGEDEIEVSGEGWFPAGNFTRNNSVLEPEEQTVLKKLLQIAAISNNSNIRHNTDKNTYNLAGDPTEGALLVLAKKAGIKFSSDASYSKIDDLPFNSKLKLRATLFGNTKDREYLIVGAPEKILELSTSILTPKGEIPMDDFASDAIRDKIEEWSNKAMRVIGLAYKKVSASDESIDENGVEELVFVGITGMIDPPRPDAREAVQKCRIAGIRVIMATGDHINTAIAIARSVAIIDENDNSDIMALNEQQLAKLDEQEFDEAIRKVNVFARLTPKTKLRIAQRLQAMGELVAMTGDGVNDAPALKQADVGVSMGIMGTDVARDASQVVLADDNFSTIVSAVEEGRIVFTNARQTSFFLVTTNFAEITTLVTLVALGFPMALTATQILWLNLVTDGVGDIALATEQGHNDVLEEKPVSKKDKILNWSILPFLLMMAGIMTILSLIVYFYFLPEGIEKARTTVFIVMAFSQLFNLYNMRSLKKSVFEIGFFSNKYINLAVFVSVIIQIVIIEIPFFERIFLFDPVYPLEFITLVAMSSLVLWGGEFYKFIKRKLHLAN
jgi:P-type Ca2+ transporter type 2C